MTAGTPAGREDLAGADTTQAVPVSPDELMSSAGLRRAIDRMDLSVSGYAALIGAGKRTVQQWLSNSRRIPAIAARITTLMLADRQNLDRLKALGVTGGDRDHDTVSKGDDLT